MELLPLRGAMALAGLALLGWATPAWANCTASIDCHNGCSSSIQCQAPFEPTPLICVAASQTLSCSGPNTGSVCSSTAHSVTCDGVTQTCSVQTCTSTFSSVTCGAVTRNCTHCPGLLFNC